MGYASFREGSNKKKRKKEREKDNNSSPNSKTSRTNKKNENQNPKTKKGKTNCELELWKTSKKLVCTCKNFQYETCLSLLAPILRINQTKPTSSTGSSCSTQILIGLAMSKSNFSFVIRASLHHDAKVLTSAFRGKGWGHSIKHWPLPWGISGRI